MSKQDEERGQAIMGLIIFVIFIVGIVWGFPWLASQPLPKAPIEVCTPTTWMIERRFGIDVNTGTTDQDEARKLAGENRIYMGEICRYE